MRGGLAGNHDVPLFAAWHRLWHPYRRWTRALGAPVLHGPDPPWLRLVPVDSVRPLRHRRGAVSTEPRWRASAELRASSPEQLRIAALHPPPVAAHPRDRLQTFGGAAEALRD